VRGRLEVSDDPYREIMARLYRELPTMDAAERTEHYEVSTRQDGGLLTRARARTHELIVDEPSGFGTDTAANPAEVALAALGASLEVTTRVYAAHLGLETRSISTTLTSDLDLPAFLGEAPPDVRAGFTNVAVTVTIDLGGQAEGDQLERLVETVNRCCPILDVFRSPVPVDLRIVASPQAEGAAEAQRGKE
jgi:uncharacterized OsmC-like protein